ncbi:helix-turn-helix domain-containing protein [Parafilimonas terrae]|uniref:Transcriptional regulator, AraC family n=1 Tax=Parafilimonas terrae TaxID=1465490 RepID=A0A1I5XT42_9BACT|nr:helix-turn-helix domain-containing protein [Parafilimonas terrae]SFQ35080.1 transcriptional regulator, AraC family [Parafilimonas terrae]
MSFYKITPTEELKPYVNHFAISESLQQHTYKVFPSTKLVIGFQYKGFLNSVENNLQNTLATAGITGIQNSFKTFENTVVTGTVLVYFTETGFTYFSSLPAHELFNQSVSLDNIFEKNKIEETEYKLSLAASHTGKIKIIEQFLLSQLKERKEDKLIVEAVKLIYQSNGLIKIKELTQKLFISQSPFEKRFRSLVGTTPKKFASIVRFNAVIGDLKKARSLTDLCFEHNFFDQAHFIKDFKQYTGDTPENFKRLL